MNKIILEADTELKDNELREIVVKLMSKVSNMNNRIKENSRQIRQRLKK